MRNVFKVLAVVLIMGLSLTSCTNDSFAEDRNLYEQGTEGNDGSVEDKPEQ
ncbi:hypothetical protein [Poritiphilus flavus]|uniref:hypothetical protein n=1 Tax=Poritiphilus flavus TaxID=2697053 RepID=UPI001EEB6FB8|nr:hypothetical protein [Poritiphilus flavus]